MQPFKLPSFDPETERKFQDHGTDTSPGLRIVSPQNSDSGLHPGWYREQPQRETWPEELPIKKRTHGYPASWDKPAREPLDIVRLTGWVVLCILVPSLAIILLVVLWRVIGALATVKLV